MALTTGLIPNFLNGVSQQDAVLRLSSQAEEQINGFSTTIEGLKKRNPSRHAASLMTAPAGSVFSHTINRDAVERYSVLISDQSLRVFDLEGNEKLVSFPDGLSYLDTDDPRSEITALTVADYTFIVNKTVSVAASNSMSPARSMPYEALVNIKAGNYGKFYRIYLNGGVAGSKTTLNGASASDAPYVDTVYIAGELVTSLAGNGYGPTGTWVVHQYGNAIYIGSNTNFTISVEDGFNGNATSVAKDTVQRFTDLPNYGPEGFIVRVLGDNSTQFDDYWVKLGKNGVWSETVAPSIPWRLDALTMPHVLVRESNGEFTFRAQAWADRLAGDADSSPMPSFVSNKIADVFFSRNRLGFLANENAILSQSGQFFNFFRQTVTAVLDDDPIDVSAAHTKVSTLRHAVPLRDALILFSDSTQFTAKAGSQGILTPKTIAITPTTELPCSQYAKPIATGDLIYFLSDVSTTRVYEYKIDTDTQQLSGEEITAHVTSYIPAGTTKVAGSAKHNIMAIFMPEDPSTIYCYQWTVQGNQRIQSAFHKWTMGEGSSVLGIDFIDADMVVTINRGGTIYLERINVDVGVHDLGSPWWTNLDRRVHLSNGTYDAVLDRTAYQLPYIVTSAVRASVAPDNEDDDFNTGVELDFDSRSGTTAYLKGNTAGASVFFGFPYRFTYRLSPIYPKSATRSGGEQIIPNARLQLRYLTVVHGRNTTGVFVNVVPQGRTEYTFDLADYVTGFSELDNVPIPAESVISRVPIMSRSDTTSIEFVSDSHLPCALIAAQWEGQLHVKARPASA